MQKLKIKNFGPINQGYSDGFFDINKCTVIIGEQGSGKSTIAKIYSVFSWLEKDLFRTQDDKKTFGSAEFKNVCKNQKIDEYFTEGTELEYEGDAYSFSFKNILFSYHKKHNSYSKPKIMYIPSERNLLTVLESADKVEKLPSMLRLLQKEYSNALSESSGKELDLPVSNFKLRFDKQSQKTNVVYNSKEIKIQNASSGLQSLVPISVVVNYLSKDVDKPLTDFAANFSNYDIEKIKKIIASKWDDILICEHLVNVFEKNYLNGNIAVIDDNDKNMIEQAISDYVNTCLFTIVEEPEQNLFPVSQVEVLNELIRMNNNRESNKLLLTTHSPYILSALNNFIYAQEIYEKRGKTIPEIEKTVFLDINDVSAYKVEDGKIIDIKNTDYNLIDTTQIDDCSSMINSVFDKLVTLDE